jgi:hypothetical protein
MYLHAKFQDPALNGAIVSTSQVCMVSILMTGRYKALRWEGLQWHDIHTNFHKLCQFVYTMLMSISESEGRKMDIYLQLTNRTVSMETFDANTWH